MEYFSPCVYWRAHDIILPCKSNYTLRILWLIKRIHLTMSGSMKFVKANNSVMVGACWRLETGANSTVNKIYEPFASMGFVV